MFFIFSFLHFPCKFFFFLRPNLNCDPINENDFERRIVWCKHREDPTNTLEMAKVQKHFLPQQVSGNQPEVKDLVLPCHLPGTQTPLAGQQTLLANPQTPLAGMGVGEEHEQGRPK